MHLSTTTTFQADLFADLKAACEGRPAGPDPRDDERRALCKPAPNAVQWIVNPSYADSPSLFNYKRSYQIIRDVFQLRCPVCNTGPVDSMVRTPDELRREILLEWSEEKNDDVCPRCSSSRRELEEDGLLEKVNALHLVCGQRSGKSVTAALIGTYVEHRILTIAHSHPGGLHAYLGLVIKDPWEMTFLASNEVQGKDTIWAKYRAFRADAPWFKRYTSWVKDEEKHQSTPPGMERWEYSETDKVIKNEHPDLGALIINSLNSNSSGLRGRTRLFNGVDEIAYMQGGDSAMSADEIYRATDNSLQTVRSRAKDHDRQRWLGLMCSVSSPRHKNDKSMRLWREAEGGKVPGMLAYKYATWEFNPYEPRENFAQMYAKDPIGAERDFGANPPMAASPLIHDRERFRDLVVGNHEPKAEFRYPQFTEEGHEYIGVQVFHASLVSEGNHFVAFDAGKNFDAFAGACGHGETVVDDQGTERMVTVIDWVARILPPVGCEVYYDNVHAVLVKLQRMMHLATVEFDRWNSTQLIQQIRRSGIRAETKSLRNDDWTRFRTDAYSGLVRMLPPEPGEVSEKTGEFIVDPPLMSPQCCALYELEALERDPETGKVWNSKKGEQRGYESNDVAQVVVHVHKMVQEQGYSQKHDDRSREAARRRSEADSARFLYARQGGVYNPGGRGGGPRNWRSGRGW